jgi:hypothetical protein
MNRRLRNEQRIAMSDTTHELTRTGLTPTFGKYQERTQRTIPVVELLPAKQ